VGLLKSSFDKRPLNVWRHVEINLKLIHMAFRLRPIRSGAMLGLKA
jgi:hypothetical protein